MSKQLLAQSARRARGASLVELAIVLFLLFAIVFGCVDFGRFAMTSIAVTNAAREGANLGSLHPFTATTHQLWKDKIRQAIVDEMSSVSGFDESELNISEPTVIADDDGTSRVSVRVQYPFRPVVPWLVIPQQMDISRKAEMRVIR